MMRLASLIAFILWLPAQSADAIQQSDRLFSYGEDPARDRQALALIERAMTSQPNSYQLLWRASRGYYHVGDDAPSKEKTNYYERGIDAGRRAVALEPNGAEGHFWLGANYGGVGEQKGMFKALQLIGKIRAEMETVVRLNPGYEDGNAYLALGELDRQLPRLLGGSTSRSIGYCEQGLQLAPRNLELKLSLARGYLEAGRRDDARRKLEEMLGQQINPERARAERGLQDEARRMLGTR